MFDIVVSTWSLWYFVLTTTTRQQHQYWRVFQAQLYMWMWNDVIVGSTQYIWTALA